MILIDECNRRIKEGDNYYIVTVYDEDHFPIKGYTDRIFKNKNDLNRFVKLVEEADNRYFVTSRQSIYSGSGWGV